MKRLTLTTETLDKIYKSELNERERVVNCTLLILTDVDKYTPRLITGHHLHRYPRLDSSKASVALAHKLARIIWAILRDQKPFITEAR